MLKKPIMLTTIFLLLVTVGCSSKKADIKQKQAGLYFGAGTQMLMEKKYTDALINLLKANELEPNNPDTLNNLAMAYYFKNQKDLAWATIKKALEINPDHSDSKVNMASFYYNEGKLDQAEKLYQQVLKDLVYDKQARTYYNLGSIAIDKKQTANAKNYFKKSIEEDENYCPSHYQLGLLQMSSRQFKKAYQSFRNATMGVCVNSPAPHYYQALTLIELKKFDEARLKLDEVERKFIHTDFSAKARQKAMELNQIEAGYNSEYSEVILTPEKNLGF